MAKFYYNRVLLPELPNPTDISDDAFLSDYKYFHIVKQVSKSDESSNHILYVSAGDWMYVDTEGGMVGTVNSLVAIKYNLVNDEWVVDEENSPECPFVYFISADDLYYYEPIWSSHNILTADENTGEPIGGIYMSLSYPIPEDDLLTIFETDIVISETYNVNDYGCTLNTVLLTSEEDTFDVTFGDKTYYGLKTESLTVDGLSSFVLGNKYLALEQFIFIFGSVEAILEMYPEFAVFNENTGEPFLIMNDPNTNSGAIISESTTPGTYHFKVAKASGSSSGGDTDDPSDSMLILPKILLTNVADAIREKTGKTDLMYLSQMPEEIEGIVAGSGSREEVLFDSDITTNDISQYLIAPSLSINTGDIVNITLGDATYEDLEVCEYSLNGVQTICAGNKYLFLSALSKNSGYSIDMLLSSNADLAVMNDDTGEPFYIQFNVTNTDTGEVTDAMMTDSPNSSYHLRITKASDSSDSSGSSGSGNNSDDPSDSMLIVSKTLLTNIANSIRKKTGKTDLMYISQMPDFIRSI